MIKLAKKVSKEVLTRSVRHYLTYILFIITYTTGMGSGGEGGFPGGGFPGGFPGGGMPGGGFRFSARDPSDIFKQFFGGGDPFSMHDDDSPPFGNGTHSLTHSLTQSYINLLTK